MWWADGGWYSGLVCVCVCFQCALVETCESAETSVMIFCVCVFACFGTLFS